MNSVEQLLRKHFGVDKLKVHKTFGCASPPSKRLLKKMNLPESSSSSNNQLPKTEEEVEAILLEIFEKPLSETFTRYNGFTRMAANMHRFVNRIDDPTLDGSWQDNVGIAKKFLEKLENEDDFVNERKEKNSNFSGITFIVPECWKYSEDYKGTGAVIIGCDKLHKEKKEDRFSNGSMMFVARKWVSFALFEDFDLETFQAAEALCLPTCVFPYNYPSLIVGHSVADLMILSSEFQRSLGSERGAEVVTSSTKKIIVLLGSSDDFYADRYVFELGNTLEKMEYSVVYYFGETPYSEESRKRELKSCMASQRGYWDLLANKKNKSGGKFELFKIKHWSFMLSSIVHVLTMMIPEPGDGTEETTRMKLEMCSDLEALRVCPEFGDRRHEKDDDYLYTVFYHVLEHSIETLHDINRDTIFINPFMIAMTYIHEIAWGKRDGIELTNDSLGSLELNKNIETLVAELKRTNLINGGPLSGIIFTTDPASENTTHFNQLINAGARCIGIDKMIVADYNGVAYKNGAFFVSEEMTVFAINSGIELNLRRNAELLGVYTVAFYKQRHSSEGITITARSFDDLKSIAAAMGKSTKILKKETRRNCDSTKILFSMGKKTYEDDLILFKMGEDLAKEGHPCFYYFMTSYMDEGAIRKVMSSDEEWTKAVESQCHPSEKFDIRITPCWSFAITWLTVAVKKSESFDYGAAIHLTAPIPGLNGSFQITRNANCQQGMFDFANKIINELLPKAIDNEEI